jgi:cold shock CspA family protein
MIVNNVNNRLIRIGVFYDGNYFLHVSNFYNFSHPRRARISISGLHDFVRRHIAELEGVDPRYCQVVDTHYFRGRLPAHEAKSRNKLLSERLFDDILMKEGVITHYLPLSNRGEKGIDVWLALEAFEAVVQKQYNVLVIIACDSDFVPLVRKINAMGTRVMVLGWDFEYTDEFGNRRVTVTSSSLLQEVTYPVLMHKLIDEKANQGDPQIENLFVPKDQNYSLKALEQYTPESAEQRYTGRVQNIKEGYGFIETETAGRNLFFYWEDVQGDFNELHPNDWVEYSLGTNHRGECAIEVVKLNPSKGINYAADDSYEGEQVDPHLPHFDEDDYPDTVEQRAREQDPALQEPDQQESVSSNAGGR